MVRETVQQLRAMTAVVGNLDLVPSTYQAAHNQL